MLSKYFNALASITAASIYGQPHYIDSIFPQDQTCSCKLNL
ncbi:hypothetical protein P3J6_121590 [Pseudoalteromonas sp. 3J6]|nr:hypothetical protein P3J6_121590 [Pseudoalteromonas sp. 3J6]